MLLDEEDFSLKHVGRFFTFNIKHVVELWRFNFANVAHPFVTIFKERSPVHERLSHHKVHKLNTHLKLGIAVSDHASCSLSV